MITLTGTPTLETERLHLRAPRPADAPTYMAFYGTDRSQFTGGPMTERQAWNFFGTQFGHWAIHGFGMFIVTYKGEDTPLGIVGHWYPHGWPEKEVGWVLFDSAHEGKGIAFEAAQACIDHAWTTLKWDTIVSYIAHGNDASVALAKRLGATLDETAIQPKPDTPGYVYRHRKGAI
ncbi:GNAT family N-acetyltransferase [Tateyamaria sp. SN3-11]|uniref:GNAT family N-acetyltransferase n=1 Tax=Tateyamaria sp. SN3-11 TaxID=3092147 RepID=UPI0039E969EA